MNDENTMTAQQIIISSDKMYRKGLHDNFFDTKKTILDVRTLTK